MENFNNVFYNLAGVLQSVPNAAAVLRGDSAHPNLRGVVLFFATAQGVLAAAQMRGLPRGNNSCARPFFGFHIHSGEECTGNATDPFANAGMHLNPQGCPHPSHMGDMPPLPGADGNALLVFLTDRFEISEIIGKTVIIHSSPDDFTTQPSGNSGTKIACGKIIQFGAN